MRKSFRFSGLIALSVLALSGFPVNCGQSGAIAAPSAKNPHYAKGLAEQYERFLDACAKHDASAMDQAFKVFALPEPEEWFGKYFTHGHLSLGPWYKFSL